MAGTNKLHLTTFDSTGATPQSRLNAATAPLTQGSLYALLLKLLTLRQRGLEKSHATSSEGALFVGDLLKLTTFAPSGWLPKQFQTPCKQIRIRNCSFLLFLRREYDIMEKT